jgi:hypothetical protein
MAKSRQILKVGKENSQRVVYASLRCCTLQHTLMNHESIKTIFCDEEADSILARAVSGHSRKYALGMGSDFCFFPNVNYVPITTLHLKIKKKKRA